jgi:NADH-quinone oxidoreductase subunit H
VAEFIDKYFFDKLLFWLIPVEWTAPAYITTALIHLFLLLNLIAVGALVFIWMERKVSGRIQDRLGPTRVGGKFGWLQTLADGIKLIAKEDIMPADADPLLFRLAPYLSFAASFTTFLVLPFATGWAGQVLSVGVFFLLAVLGLEVYGVILAGYGSGSKWSLFGGMREAAQVVSYEVPLGLCVLVPVALCGSMDLVTIADQQAGLFTNWLIFHDPFTFAVFWVYFTCALASVNRAPFDLAEAESELVAGFHTEYSGLRWSIFFMAEYGSMFLVSAVAAILFFGGWHGPLPIFAPAADAGGFLGYLAKVAGTANLIFKAVVGVTVMMWIRWTLPRLRIDQVITMCWKYCVPIAAVCCVGAIGFWQYLGIWSPNDLLPARDRTAVRESWLISHDRAIKRSASSGGEAASSAEGLEIEAARENIDANREAPNVEGVPRVAGTSGFVAWRPPASPQENGGREVGR